MKKFVCFILLIVSGLSMAANPKATPRLSGVALIAQVKAGSTQETTGSYQQWFALGYLAGIADLSQGKSWCDTGKVKTGEIDSHRS
ncbi:hypothetical protein HZU77_013760 [Neisseriaceae bacterium TC5R-5]|nr:hypothetical protein [Neisseriaceae bacterium TC5R-5]